MKKIVSTAFLLIIVFVLICGCKVPAQKSGDSAQSATSQSIAKESEKVVRVAIISEPASMDNAIGNDPISSMALCMSFEGLLNNVNGVISPGIAESYEVSADGLTYTFSLRPAKWSDGKEVTAEDFVSTWKRILTRKDAMDLAYILFPIKNAQPINEGAMDVSTLGATVIDDKTLTVELEAPYPFITSLLAFCVFLPQRVDMIDKYGTQYGLSPDTIVQNGPYLLTEWIHENKMVFIKNPDYWNADAVKIDKVIINVIPDMNTIKNMYTAGDIDFMDVPDNMIDQFVDDPTYKYLPCGRVQFLCLSQKGTSPEAAKILRNRNFIMALSYAVDRAGYAKALYPLYEPFSGVINPWIYDPANKKKWGETYNIENKYHPIMVNEAKAQEYLAAALKDLGYSSAEELPVFDFLTRDPEIYRLSAEYFQDVFNRVLGLKVEIRPLKTVQFFENFYSAPYDIAFSGWTPDYDDPYTFLDMWNSKGGWNKTGWVNDTYNDLIVDANKQTDLLKRDEMFVEAERILLTEAPIIPLLVKRAAYVCNPRLVGMSVNAFGTTFDFRYADIVE